MSNLDLKYVASACPELTQSECDALLCHARDITRSASDIYPDMLRATSRSLFPDIERRRANPPISPADIDRINSYRINEAIADLEAAQKMLRKVRGPSDDVAVALRDLGLVIELLGGGE